VRPTDYCLFVFLRVCKAVDSFVSLFSYQVIHFPMMTSTDQSTFDLAFGYNVEMTKSVSDTSESGDEDNSALRTPLVVRNSRWSPFIMWGLLVSIVLSTFAVWVLYVN
jgi:hypothetical protein